MVTIRPGSASEAVELARRLPDFPNPYNLNEPDTPIPKLDHVLIAELDGVPVGFRAGCWHSADTFAVWLAGVLPEHRGQGIGGALYRAGADWLRSQRCRYLRTHVRNSNRAMMRILVEKGYDVVDVTAYDDPGRNKVVFVKDLWDRDRRSTSGPLVVGLLKGGSHEDAPELQAWLRDVTISWLRFKYAGRIIEASSVDSILDQACAAGSRYCLILAHGTILSHAWRLELVETIVTWAQEREFLAAGTIEQAPDGPPGISPRGILIDLTRYQELSKPRFGEPDLSGVGASFFQTLRGPGWNLVRAGLEAGLAPLPPHEELAATLLDVAPQNPGQVDALKKILGPAIATETLDQDVLSHGQFQFLGAVQRQVQNSRKGIFVWNFEGYDDVSSPPAAFDPPVATLYSVAAGLKTNWILHTHGFNETTRLVYFDYSEQALRFKQLLHQEWDGEDYPNFLDRLFKKIQPGEAFYQLWGGLSPGELGREAMNQAWNREIARWGGESVLKEHWRKARELPVDYVLCNVLEDQSRLIDRIHDQPHNVIWWSNVFFTFYSNWFHTIESRRAIYEGFVRRLTERSPGCLMYGHDYNNIVVRGLPARDYARAYFQTADDPLEPRAIGGLGSNRPRGIGITERAPDPGRG